MQTQAHVHARTYACAHTHAHTRAHTHVHTRTHCVCSGMLILPEKRRYVTGTLGFFRGTLGYSRVLSHDHSARGALRKRTEVGKRIGHEECVEVGLEASCTVTLVWGASSH